MSSFRPARWVPLASRAGIEAATINTLIDALVGLNPSSATFATTNTAAANVAAVQAVINTAFTQGAPVVTLPEGTFTWDLVDHPNPSDTTHCGLALRKGMTLRGAGMGKTILKMGNGTAATSSWITVDPTVKAQNRFITNWDRNGGTDSNIWIEDLTLDGNCANNTTTNKCMHGAQFWNCPGSGYRRVEFKNIRGDNTGTLETFHADFVRSQDCTIEDCRITCDDGGNTASGVSLNFSDRAFISGTTVTNMSNGQGFTYYASASPTTVNCYAGGNSSAGFNEEDCSDYLYTNCISGAENARTDSSTASTDYTHGAANGNSEGFVLLHTHGGGRGSFVNCDARGNTVRNIGYTGAVQGLSTTGTTDVGSHTIVLTTQLFYQPMVGNPVNVNGGTWVKILTVTGSGSSTTCTTDAAHGGGPGQTVLIRPGRTSFAGIVTGSDKGVQFTGASTLLKQLDARSFDTTHAQIYDNTTDMENVGNGSSTSVPRASGQASSATTSNQTSGVEFFNPFPRDMWAMVSGSSGSTSIRGPHPKDTSVTTGIGDGTFPVKCGGAINATGTVRWFHP